MKRDLVIRPSAQADIDDHAEYIARDSGVAGRAFLEAIERTIASLADWPHLGAPWAAAHNRLSGIRRVPVADFRNWLVFYRVSDDVVEVLRVFHGAQDIQHLLEIEET